MGFVKVLKNKAYYKRYQVKFRRRRECKTDYHRRQRLIIQDKNKYNSPKYRFCVRFSNKEVVCQVFSASPTHDVCLTEARSSELPRYGVPVGLTNYPAAYCTGLLCARRVNAKFALADRYTGVEAADGKEYHVEKEGDGPAPFRCFLDVGLQRTTTGCKIFAALKGAVDGGLDIPHNTRRFAGSSKTEDGYEYDAEVNRQKILGGHIANYMNHLAEEDEEAFKKQFARFIAHGVTAEKLEGMYIEAHAAIRADPNRKRDPLQRGRFQVRAKAKDAEFEYPKKRFSRVKQSIQQRKARVKQKLRAMGKETLEAVPTL